MYIGGILKDKQDVEEHLTPRVRHRIREDSKLVLAYVDERGNKFFLCKGPDEFYWSFPYDPKVAPSSRATLDDISSHIQTCDDQSTRCDFFGGLLLSSSGLPHFRENMKTFIRHLRFGTEPTGFEEASKARPCLYGRAIDY